MPVKDLSYFDVSNPLGQGILTDDQLDEVRKRKEAFDKLLKEQGKAKHKIEVTFAKNYSMNGLNAGAVTFWESGTKLHGGGDASMHVCPGKALKRNNCEGFIPDMANGLGFMICPTCKLQWKSEEVIGQVLFKLPLSKWADVLLKYFQRLEGDADLSMKRYPGSIIQASSKEQEKQCGDEVHNAVRNQRMVYVYPLANIIRDTSTGADLRGRILAFLKA